MKQYLVFLAVAAPYFYDRYLAFSNIVANGPGKLEHVNTFKSYETKFTDRLKNCEDLVMHENLGIAFLSCDPGRDRWNTVMVRSSSREPYKKTGSINAIKRAISIPHAHPSLKAQYGSTTTPQPPTPSPH